MINIQHTTSVTHGGLHGEAQVDPAVMQANASLVNSNVEIPNFGQFMGTSE